MTKLTIPCSPVFFLKHEEKSEKGKEYLLLLG